MIVHMTGLYTRLVTYARLHIMTLVVSFCHKISYTSSIDLFLILIILLPFIFRLSCYCLHCFYARAPFPLHTHSLGRFWQLWIRTTRILDTLLFRCSCDRTLREEVEFLSFWFWYSCLSLFLLLLFDYCNHT